MRIFKTKPFARFADHEGIEDTALCDAVRRAEQGLVDADLGGGSANREKLGYSAGTARRHRASDLKSAARSRGQPAVRGVLDLGAARA